LGQRRRLWLVSALALLLVLGWWATSGPPAPTPDPPGTFSFAALGDAPYFPWEDVQYRLALRWLDEHELALVLHVGDLFWRPCTDELYRRSLEWLDELRHPVLYTPGDNEWTDCWEPGSGGFAPRERLERIRQLFFADPAHSLGGSKLALASQAGREPYSEFAENQRLIHDGIVFATVHLVGSHNGFDPFPGRTEADDEAARRRTAAATEWMREAFGEAKARGAVAVVLAWHANPAFEASTDDPYRASYEPFLSALEEEVERFGGPVLAVQGDEHVFVVDHPLVRRTTGARLENFTRLQVPGSPRVGWVRVVVTPGATSPFAFEQHVVPRWKYW